MSANVFHPSRGGVRGGKDQFNWDDVKTDKDRENYLGKYKTMPTVCITGMRDKISVHHQERSGPGYSGYSNNKSGGGGLFIYLNSGGA